MQYIFTEEEYFKLRDAPKHVAKEKENLINYLCVEVAINKPVKYWGNTEAKKWGCIHADFEDERAEYCDECPVQKHCTKSKSWSK